MIVIDIIEMIGNVDGMQRHIGRVHTSARIVLDEELVQGHPAAADTHHDGAAQDANQAQFLRISKL